ncbi:MAG: hypothetical protein ACUVRX_07280 [Actinomycetota bacterium]
MEYVRHVDDWAKSAHAQVGSFSHVREGSRMSFSRAERFIRGMEDLMVRGMGSEAVAVTILVLVLCAAYLRGRRACRHGSGSARGYDILGKRLRQSRDGV